MKFEDITNNLRSMKELFETELVALGPDLAGNPRAKFLNQSISTIQDALFCLQNYIEPWRCPGCGNSEKIPHNPRRPRLCAFCGESKCFPYQHLEVERMNAQMGILLKTASFYSTQQNGEVAEQALLQLQRVGITAERNAAAKEEPKK